MTIDYGSYEGQVVLLAGILVGATVTALDYNLRKKHLLKLINESKPEVMFCSDYSTKTIADILYDIVHKPAFKISKSVYDGFTTYSSIIASSTNLFVQPSKSVNKNRPCALIYSSGTTGVPKGIYLSEDAIKYALTSFKTLLLEEPVENRFMITSPIFWYTGFLLLMLSIHFGKPRLFFSSRPSAEQILCSIEKFKPTFTMTGVSAINEMMCCQMANGHKYNIESLTSLMIGGSPMRPELQETITENLLHGRIPIKQGYGITEQGVVAVWPMQSDINTVKTGSVGRPAAGIRIKIVSLETGECVGPNVKGEIYVKSVSNMIGYAYDMKKNVLSYDEHGWFKTGDVGYYTNDCCLFIVGRIKELMIYKGLRIAPTDVETVLLNHPDVLDAGVSSKDCLYGDLLVGLVKVKPGQHIEPVRLVSYVNERVEDHEKLRGGVLFVNEIPRTLAGKLKRDELKMLIEST
ncbi:Hypothetical protein CINCED_3A002754 [Cinara cedri]|nr:Hypothetical protein CINCED_3A002754 [Cinara cedri]